MPTQDDRLRKEYEREKAQYEQYQRERAAYEAQQKAAAPAPAPTVAAPQAPAEVPTQRLRSIAQGASFGLADELEARARSFLPSETYEQAIKDVRGKLSAYREDRPLEALGYEVAGGLVTGLAGGGRALAATAGRTGAKAAAQELAKAVARGATTSAIGQGAVSGAAGAEGGIENRLKGAAMGGAFGAALPFLGAQATRLIPGRKAIGEAASGMYDAARRGTANLLENIEIPIPMMGRVSPSRMIEPTDATRISRQAARTLPGGVEGPTAASMVGGAEAARTAESQATVAAQQGKLQARQATAARQATEEEARVALQQAKQEESTLLSLAKQRAGTVREAGVSRAERLTGVSKAATAEAKAIQTGATKEARQAKLVANEQAKAAAEDALDQARLAAGETISSLRGQQPRGSAQSLQENIRNAQTSEATGHYDAVRSFGAPPEPDPEIYREVFANPALRNAYEDSIATLRKETRNVAPDAPAIAPGRTININGAKVPELTLEAMDQMRRNIMAPQMRKGPDVVGLSRSQKKEALDTINRLEERYLAGFGTDDAAKALQTARTAYREKFQILEAIQDGLNLGTAKAGKASGLLTQSRKELDAVTKRVKDMTDDQREAFQVGAREWFDRVVQESPDAALTLAKKFSSEASQRRLALAYGEEAVDALRAFAPDVIKAQSKAAAAKVREEGQQLAQSITQRAQGEVAPLEARAQRAAALAERAQAQKAARAEQIVGQRKAEATQRLADVGRESQAKVTSAREAARTATEEAGRLASDLTSAKIARTQAQNLPIKDIAGALGSSTRQQTFLQRLLPQMNDQQRQQAVEVIGSNIQRELQDMARAGKSPQAILQRVRELEQNDVVRAMFAGKMQQFTKQLTPTIGTRLPQMFRPALSGAVSRRIAGNLNE